MRPAKPLWLALVALWGAESGCFSPPVDLDPAPPQDPVVVPDDPPPAPPPGPEACDQPSPSLTRPLAAHEYQRAVKSLLGPTTAQMAAPLPALQSWLPVWDWPAQPDHTLVEVVFTNARQLARHFVEGPDLAAALPCATTLLPSRSECASRFIKTFGRQSLRRPLRQDEHLTFLALFEREAGRNSFQTGIEAVLRAMLLHPEFLLHVERGVAGSSEQLRNLGPHELANRLAFALRGEAPDAELAKAADENRLGTRAAIEAQVERLLNAPEGEESVLRFYRQWLQLDRVLSQSKDPALYPFWNADLAREALQESLDFARWNFFESNGNLETLLMDPRALLTPNLAALYGVEHRQGWLNLPSSERAGILTRAAFLASNYGHKQLYPTPLGSHLLRELLCIDFPLPPANAVDVPPPETDTQELTTRQRLETLTMNPSCRSCHEMVDPFGYAFGHYDPVGSFQTLEDGKLIDASGRLSLDVDGRIFNDRWTTAVGLSRALAKAPAVKTCMAQQLWRHFMGRTVETERDGCMLQRLQNTMEQEGANLRPLWVQAMTDPLFTQIFVDAPAPQKTADNDQLSLPEGKNPEHSALLLAAWQFRNTARAVPAQAGETMEAWASSFQDLAKRFDHQGLDGL